MAYNGAGVFVRLYNWVTDKANGIKVRADRMDAEMDGFATGLSNAVTKDGQTTITADLPMASHKFTGLSAGSAAGHSVRWEQVLLNAGVGGWTAEAAVASAATCDILGAASEKIEITGTATITSFGTGTNKVRFVRFSGACLLTHNATTLILPGGVNIKTAAGDTCIVSSDASSNARVLAYQNYVAPTTVLDGSETLAGGTTAYTLTSNRVLTALADGVKVTAKVNATNTGASTLAVDGLAAKAIRKYGAASDAAIAAGELPKNYHAIFQYDASANAAAGAWVLVNPNPVPEPGGLWGLTVSNNGSDATNDLDIAAGFCTDDTNTLRITVEAITKRLDAAWAVGTGNGGLDTGSIANTTYHIFAIYRSDTGVSDVLFSASLASPTMPSGYTHKRRILSLQRTGGAWQSIYQHGDYVLLKTAVADVSAYALTSTATDFTLASIPNGIVVMVHMTSSIGDSAAVAIATVFSKQGNDIAPGAGAGNPGVAATGATVTQAHGQNMVLSNSSQQVRADAFANSDSFTIVVLGWIDPRGRSF